MAIKGLTDPESLRPRLPRLGKLRKGGEKTSNGFGPDLDHFRFTSDSELIADVFGAAFGPEPQSLLVYLPYQTLAENFPTWSELWSASGLEHRCDGETMAIWREGSQMRRGSQPCPGGHKGNDYRKDAVGRLEVVVPQLLSAGFVGTVTIETHSLNDIAFISGVLADVEAKRGDLRGIGWRLYRQKESISAPGWGDRKDQRARVDKWLVKIEPAAEWVLHELGRSRAEALALTPGVVNEETGEIMPHELPMLAEPVIVDPPASKRAAITNGHTTHQAPPAPTPAESSAPETAKKTVRKQAQLRIPIPSFTAFCALYAKKYADYRLSTGDPDRATILATAANLGYAEITPENWELIQDLLDRHASGQPTQVPL